MTPTEASHVQPRQGQLWASNDRRDRESGERQHLRIIDLQLEPPFSAPPFFEATEAWVEFHNEDTAKRTRVKVRRLRPNSTGYRLVSEASHVQ